MKAKMFAALAGLSLFTGAAPTAAQSAGTACDRACMTGMVRSVLSSMVAHKPEALPLASIYTATENSHPAALGMMQSWRTITKAGEPSLLAVDPAAGRAYFALTVSEAGNQSVLWGRIKVSDRKIAEIELFLNRSRGDHGFSFSADQLPGNYRAMMAPPANRRVATRAELEALAAASFDPTYPLEVGVDDKCQFTEVGSKVIDPGLDDVPPPAMPGGMKMDPNRPLNCLFPPFRPSDKNARVVAIDDKLGIVVVAAVIPGKVFPYPFYGKMVSAFIPSEMKQPSDAQEAWMKRHVAAGKAPVARPEPATGEVMQVLQYYNGKLQAVQINVYLSGPGAQSIWTLK